MSKLKPFSPRSDSAVGVYIMRALLLKPFLPLLIIFLDTIYRLEKQCEVILLADAAAGARGEKAVLIDEPQAKFTYEQTGTERASYFQASVSCSGRRCVE